VPKAPRNEITGWLSDTLKVKIKAPPPEGRANAVLCEFLAANLRLPQHAVSVVTGETSRQKRMRFTGLTLADLRRRLTHLSSIR
jgi:uncharacterized protein (TIGR00251 family)